jgi:exopolysaccharide biosynthesis polyprenyl glycosylphosphotransferase
MQRQLEVSRALWRLLGDIVLMELALLVASVVRPVLPFGKFVPVFRAQLSPVVYLMVALFWVVASLLLSIYVPRRQRAVDEAQGVFVAITLATAILAGALYFSFRGISRLQILMFYGLAVLFLIGSRLLARGVLTLFGRPYYAKRRVLILGAGEEGAEVARMVSGHIWAGLEPVGFLDDELPPQTQVEGYPVLGKVAEVEHWIEAEEIQEVVVALPLRDYDQFFRLIARLQKLPIQIRLVPDYVKTALFRTMVEQFAGVPMIALQEPTLTPFERKIKRAFDLIAGTTMFVLILPAMAFIAAAIRLDSPGPVLYKQRRVGEDGQLFWMHKFRSMVEGAEQQLDALIHTTENGQVLFKFPDDPRVTRVGRFLRRTSLDELPQLANILKGEMSLVGPRPELPWLVDQYEPWQRQRFSVPPGITGWWQINGRSDKPQHLHTEEDLHYIQHYSLLLDLRILWRTLGVVIRGRGSY